MNSQYKACLKKNESKGCCLPQEHVECSTDSLTQAADEASLYLYLKCMFSQSFLGACMEVNTQLRPTSTCVTALLTIHFDQMHSFLLPPP